MQVLLLFKEIDWTKFGLVVAIMAGIGLFFGLLIVFISKFCAIKADPKIGEVLSHLSGANCGGCGHAGCEGFAKALVEGKASIDDCGQTTKANKIEISNILGISYAGGEETVAVVACNGGIHCDDKYDYQGYGNCISQQILANGRKACIAGCMGAGSCVDVCPNLAIECRDGYAQIDPELCVSCGVCIRTCPKHLIKRVPRSAKIYVGCNSQCKGREVMDVCKTGCISCGLCQRTCKFDAIHLVNNVPIIDYSKCTACMECYKICPRKVIKKLK
jgi:electron transport complex protein RnfB